MRTRIGAITKYRNSLLDTDCSFLYVYRYTYTYICTYVIVFPICGCLKDVKKPKPTHRHYGDVNSIVAA